MKKILDYSKVALLCTGMMLGSIAYTKYQVNRVTAEMNAKFEAYADIDKMLTGEIYRVSNTCNEDLTKRLNLLARMMGR